LITRRLRDRLDASLDALEDTAQVMEAMSDGA